ncbi:MAG: aldo/keto reductase [Devosia sp.]|uniref:aldo/keto reductase n=1 Tax=Devosia sp. TaxID=1871048 RepID=UPI001A3D268A|nr:aldo/keto reductase [Devosia sp.]MBL8598854.1 aldo/keto reductase [Devosia sp.]
MWSDRVILGTAELGTDGREHAFDLLDEYVRLGGRSIDSAAVYSDWVPGEAGRSETVIGEWLKRRGRRDDLAIITKGAHPPLGHMDQPRCDEASIRHDVEQSLRRLGIEQIDLWYLHRDDPARPVAEIVGVLQALEREGKIARFGCSNWTGPRIEAAKALPGPTFASTQVLGNAFCRIMNPLADKTCVVLDAPAFHQAVTHRMSLFLYSSTANGFFERRGNGLAPHRLYANTACAEAAISLDALAAELGIHPGNMIVAFMLQLAPQVRTIVGSRTAEQLRPVWKGGDTVLPAEAVHRIAGITGMADFLAA